jgi:hypothetical protein
MEEQGAQAPADLKSDRRRAPCSAGIRAPQHGDPLVWRPRPRRLVGLRPSAPVLGGGSRITAHPISEAHEVSHVRAPRSRSVYIQYESQFPIPALTTMARRAFCHPRVSQDRRKAADPSSARVARDTGATRATASRQIQRLRAEPQRTDEDTATRLPVIGTMAVPAIVARCAIVAPASRVAMIAPAGTFAAAFAFVIAILDLQDCSRRGRPKLRWWGCGRRRRARGGDDRYGACAHECFQHGQFSCVCRLVRSGAVRRIQCLGANDKGGPSRLAR